MSLLTQSKTNWKYIIIVLVLAVIVGGGILWWVKRQEVPLTELPKIEKPEEVVEDETIKEPYIKVISPNGGEEWQKGKSYTIQWNQKGLEIWGNVITICLTGFNKEENEISAAEEETECYWLIGEDYLVANTTLTENVYQWKISEDTSERFEGSPTFYKINLSVFDHLPPEGRTEWAGFIAGDDSDDYFSIISE